VLGDSARTNLPSTRNIFGVCELSHASSDFGSVL